jgi:hypothetical protein
MAAHVVNIDEVPELEGAIVRPGSDPVPGTEHKLTRFLGRADDNALDPEQPPFVYYIKRPKGDVTPDHSHKANRVEFVIEGSIEWRERGKAPVVYGANTLTYVEAGTVYGYTVLEDATILIVFDAPPSVSHPSAARGAF